MKTFDAMMETTSIKMDPSVVSDVDIFNEMSIGNKIAVRLENVNGEGHFGAVNKIVNKTITKVNGVTKNVYRLRLFSPNQGNYVIMPKDIRYFMFVRY